MMADDAASDVADRLTRLGREEPTCDLDEYRTWADDVRHDAAFRDQLTRAKALADRNRLTALHLLDRHGSLCACEIQAALELTHATVSHHMSCLQEAGLVEAERRGKWRYYDLTDAAETFLE